MMKYYPLAKGNNWTYKQKDGSLYTNSVVRVEGNLVTMQNSTMSEPSFVRIDGGTLYNELMGKDNFQLWLKDELVAGDTWEAAFTANGLNSVMAFTVKETGISREVEGTMYPDVVLIEAESKINMNGNLISTQFFTQYYYAKNTGLILTTTSMGDVHALVKADLN